MLTSGSSVPIEPTAGRFQKLSHGAELVCKLEQGSSCVEVQRAPSPLFPACSQWGRCCRLVSLGGAGLCSEIFWTALSQRRGRLKLSGAASQRQTHLAMNLLLSLAVAVPLSCLAFLSWLALLGVMTLGAVINVIGMARAGGPQWPRVEPANS
jgi:hypothetical protein